MQLVGMLDSPYVRRVAVALIVAGVDPSDFADPQVVHCGMVEEIEHAEIGALRQVASPIRMEAMGASSTRMPPPRLGEHTRETLADFGLSPERIQALASLGVVMQARQVERA